MSAVRTPRLASPARRLSAASPSATRVLVATIASPGSSAPVGHAKSAWRRTRSSPAVRTRGPPRASPILPRGRPRRTRPRAVRSAARFSRGARPATHAVRPTAPCARPSRRCPRGCRGICPRRRAVEYRRTAGRRLTTILTAPTSVRRMRSPGMFPPVRRRRPRRLACGGSRPRAWR